MEPMNVTALLHALLDYRHHCVGDCCKCSEMLLKVVLNRRGAMRFQPFCVGMVAAEMIVRGAQGSVFEPVRLCADRTLSMKASSMKNIGLVILLALASTAFTASAQQAAAATATTAPTAPAWKYKTKQLSRDEVDVLLAKPDKLLVLDVRRPDEHIRYGSFPVFLSVQASELEKQLAYLPKDRLILTVSNHAQRAGAAGDLLAAKGYTIAGATGSEDYEREGGKAVAHVQPPAPRAAASAP